MRRSWTALAALLTLIGGATAAPLTVNEMTLRFQIPPDAEPGPIAASLAAAVGKDRHEGGVVWQDADREFSTQLPVQVRKFEERGETYLEVEVGAGSLETDRPRDRRDGMKLCDAAFHLDLALDWFGDRYEVRLTYGGGVNSSMNGEHWNGDSSDATWFLSDPVHDRTATVEAYLGRLRVDLDAQEMISRQLYDYDDGQPFFTGHWFKNGEQVTLENPPPPGPDPDDHWDDSDYGDFDDPEAVG